MVGQSGRKKISILPLLTAPLVSRLRRKQKLVSFIAKRNKEDLIVLKELMEAGKVTPVIDRSYSFRKVPEALRYLGEEHARGKIIITMLYREEAKRGSRRSADPLVSAVG